MQGRLKGRGESWADGTRGGLKAGSGHWQDDLTKRADQGGFPKLICKRSERVKILSNSCIRKLDCMGMS